MMLYMASPDLSGIELLAPHIIPPTIEYSPDLFS